MSILGPRIRVSEQLELWMRGKAGRFKISMHLTWHKHEYSMRTAQQRRAWELPIFYARTAHKPEASRPSPREMA